MKKNFYNGDLEVGMILTTRNGNKYVLVADDFGDLDVINLSTACSNGYVYNEHKGVFAVEGGKDHKINHGPKGPLFDCGNIPFPPRLCYNVVMNYPKKGAELWKMAGPKKR